MNGRAGRPGLAGLGFVVSVLLLAPSVHAQAPAAAATLAPPTIGTAFDADLLRDLPTSDNLFALIEATEPSAISDRLAGGGLFVGQPARIGGFLGSWTQTLFRVGDVSLTDPTGSGAPLLFPDLMMWQRIDVTTAMTAPDVNTTGLAITLEPIRPAAVWERTIHIGASRGSLVSGVSPSGAPPIARLDAWERATLLAGGPVIADRLGVVLGASWTRASQFSRAAPDPVEGQVGSAFGHVVFTPNDRHEIRLLGWLARTKTPFEHASPSEASTTDQGGHVQAVWERRAPDRLPWRFFASYTGRNRAVDLAGSTRAVFERLVDGPVSEIASTSSGTVYQWSIGTRLTPSRTLAGSLHTFGVGVEASGGSAKTSPVFSGAIGELVDGYPARIWNLSNPELESIRHQIGVSIYASDRIQLMSRVAVDASVRFDSMSGSADGAATDVRWRSWLPRARIRWSVTDGWRTALFTAYARSAYRLPLDLLAVGDPAGLTFDVFRWSAPPGPNPSLDARGPLVFSAGPGARGDDAFSRIDERLKRPLADEVVVGFEAWPTRDLRLQVAGIARREDRLLGLINVGVPASAYTTLAVQDPGGDLLNPDDDRVVTAYNRLPVSFGQDRYLLTNPDQETPTFKGLDVSMMMRKDRLVLFGGATASRALVQAAHVGFGPLENDQSRPGELFTDPNAATFARGRPFNDRAYTIKLAGTYRFPADIRLGAIARYQDGQPFARVLIFPQLDQGAVAVRAFANGDSRFTFTATLDVRLQKGFSIGASRLDALLDAYNLLNLSYGLEERAAAAPDDRTATAVQPPRTVHVGLRFRF